jgi:hypothetical protein
MSKKNRTISNKAQEVIDAAFSRHPPQTPITKTNIAHARRFIAFVFDAVDHGPDYPGDAQKRRACQQLDPTTLAALSVLIRLRDIRACGIPVIEAICIKAPSFIPATCWYNNVELWKAFLGVASSSDEYHKFRGGTKTTKSQLLNQGVTNKDLVAVDVLLQRPVPRHPAAAPLLSDAVPEPEHVAGSVDVLFQRPVLRHPAATPLLSDAVPEPEHVAGSVDVLLQQPVTRHPAAAPLLSDAVPEPEHVAGSVDVLFQRPVTRHPAAAPLLSDAVPESEHVVGFTCPSCDSRLLVVKASADQQATETSDVDGKLA